MDVVVLRIWLFTSNFLYPRYRLSIWKALLLALGGLIGCFATSSPAQTLTELLDLARGSEPTYLAARANWQASQARKQQAFGALLPQLSATANSSANYRNYLATDTELPPSKDYFKSNSAQLNLTQPVWRYASLVELRQAGASMSQAELQFVAAEQELRARLVSAWLDVLAARDVAQLTARQLATAEHQWVTARRGAELGTGGHPQAEEAREHYQQMLAEMASVDADRESKVAALEQLVGPLDTFHPAVLREQAMKVDAAIEPLQSWLEASASVNPRVLAAQRGVEAARAEISKQRAGHQPTVDIVGSYGTSNQTVGSTPLQSGYRNLQATIGVQVNIPIFSGGTQSAKVTEALAAEDKALQDLEGSKREAALAVKQAWFSWRAAHVKVNTARQAFEAATVLLKAAQRGEETGLKTHLDVLQAEQQLELVKRDLYKGSYDQIAAYAKLKAATGQLAASDITSLDSRFMAANYGGSD